MDAPAGQAVGYSRAGYLLAAPAFPIFGKIFDMKSVHWVGGMGAMRWLLRFAALAGVTSLVASAVLSGCTTASSGTASVTAPAKTLSAKL